MHLYKVSQYRCSNPLFSLPSPSADQSVNLGHRISTLNSASLVINYRQLLTPRSARTNRAARIRGQLVPRSMSHISHKKHQISLDFITRSFSLTEREQIDKPQQQQQQQQFASSLDCLSREFTELCLFFLISLKTTLPARKHPLLSHN